MNIFKDQAIAAQYDDYYATELGRKVDEIEKGIFKDLLSGIPRGKMLELGCGTGHWTDFLVENEFSVDALDASDEMLAIARSKNIDANFSFGNAEKLLYKDNSFNAVSTFTMLEFVDDPQKVVSEIYRILKPSGWLVVGLLNEKSVIGKNKDNDEVFKYANFIYPNQFEILFGKFKIIKKISDVYLDAQYKLQDNHLEKLTIDPAFIGVLLQK